MSSKRNAVATESAPVATESATGAKRGRKPAPPDETKADRFKRLAVPRVTNVLHDIGAIGNLSVKSAYEYDDAQIEKMFGAMQAALDDARARFAADKKKAAAFSL